MRFFMNSCLFVVPLIYFTTENKIIVSRILLPIVITLVFGSDISAQTISGTMSLMPGEEIRLEGFNGAETYLISTATITNDGHFHLHYSENDYGVGYLI